MEYKSLTEVLEDVFEEVAETEELCPGVYYVSAKAGGFWNEYYIAEAGTPGLSAPAKRLGKPLAGHPGLLVYSLETPDSGYMAAEYEILRYRVRNGLPLSEYESLASVAVYGMVTTPEYFGEYPPPRVTPRGLTLRYRRLINGLYVIETERAELLVAACYPIWKSELPQSCAALGEQTEYDLANGIDRTFGCLFFPEHAGYLVLDELKALHKELNGVELSFS